MTKSRDIADSINRIDSSAADATAMTIDSSENVLMGTTTTSLGSNSGVVAYSTGLLGASRDGGIAADFNRRTSDGAIVDFRKDGTTVGSIGSAGSGVRLYYSGNNVGISPYSGVIYPTDGAGGAIDNSADIGASSYRFKDLYLGGGAYIGGTGSANKLDDYEEGTWTPVVAQGWTSVTFPNSYQNGNYVKVGNLVTAWFYLQFSGTNASQHVRISGLPFNSPNEPAGAFRGGAVTYFNIPVNSTGMILAYVAHNNNYIEFYSGDDVATSTNSNANASGDYLIGSVTYRAS